MTGTDHHAALCSAVIHGHEATAETILQKMIAIKTQSADIVDVTQEAVKSGFLRICRLRLQNFGRWDIRLRLQKAVESPPLCGAKWL